MNYKIIQVLRRGAWVKAFRRNASDSRILHGKGNQYDGEIYGPCK